MRAREFPMRMKAPEMSVPRSRRWIPVVLLLLLPIISTVDVTSLGTSAWATTVALTGRAAAPTLNGDGRTFDASHGTQQSLGGQMHRAAQVALRDVRMTVSALSRLKGMVSGPSVTGP